MRWSIAVPLIATALGLAGCASASRGEGTAQHQSSPTSSSAAPATLVAPATAAADPVARPASSSSTEASSSSAVTDGRTAPGPYFLGRPDAPVTIVEYSDFQ